MNSEPIRSLEWLAYGFGQTVTPARTANENISIIAIDDASLEALGNWPWSREQLAAAIRQLRKTGARVIGITLEGLDVPQNELGLKMLREFRAQNPIQSVATDSLLDRVAHQLNTDLSLAKELAATRNIFLSVPFTPAKLKPETIAPLSPLLEPHAIKDVQGDLPELYS